MTIKRFLGTGQTSGSSVSTIAPSDPDYFGEVLDVVSGTLTYSDQHAPIASGISIKTAGGTSAALVGLSFTANRKVAVQTGCYLTAAPSTECVIMETRKAAGGQGPSLHLDPSGRLAPYNGADALVTAARSAALSFPCLLLIDWIVDGGTTTGNGSVRLAYRTWGAGSATEDLTVSSINMAAVDFNQIRYIKTNGSGDLPEAYFFAPSLDDGSTTPLPPPTNPLTASHTIDPTSGTAPLTVDAECTASGGNPPYSYTFHWGDTTSTGPQSGNTASHTYSSAGSYSTTVDVTDS